MKSTTTVGLTVLMMAAILSGALASAPDIPRPQLQLGMLMHATSLFKTVLFCELHRSIITCPSSGYLSAMIIFRQLRWLPQ